MSSYLDWPSVSRHKSRDTEHHAVALLHDFDDVNNALKDRSRRRRLPLELEELISTGVSEGLAEASSIGYSLALTSECDKQRLRDIILKKVETHATPWARARVPPSVYGRLVDSYKNFVPKLRNILVANGLNHLAKQNEVAKAQALGRVQRNAVQERRTSENAEARNALVREEKVAPIAKDVDDCDRANENEEEEEAAKANNKKGVEVETDEEMIDAEKKMGRNDADSVDSNSAPKLPEPSVNDDIYDPDKDLHEPLAHRSLIVFKITSQAVVNVLYEMDPRELFQALCMTIREKKSMFSGTSYLSNVSLSDDGDITATTHNNIAEDISVLSNMSGWDRGIIDDDLGINFGSCWYYRVHVTGVKKENSLRVDLASRKQKAMLLGDLVRVNLTTLPSLRIYHIKDAAYIEDPEEGGEALAIDFYDLDQARAVLSRGLNYNGTHFDCESVQKERYLARCGTCQAYGHIYSTCSNAPRCGKCAQQHKTEYCTSRHEKCALCDAWGHGARGSKCPAKKAEKNSVRLTTNAFRRSQAVEQLKETPPLSRLQEINDSVNQNVESGCSGHPDTLQLTASATVKLSQLYLRILELNQDFERWDERLQELIKQVKDLLKLQRESRKTKDGLSRKRRALEPLVNGASNDSGRSAKRVKPEEYRAAETREL